MGEMGLGAGPAGEIATTPAASRILYGLIYRNSRPNSSRFVKELFDPPRLPPVPPALVRYESRARLSSRRGPTNISLLREVALHDLGRVPAAVQRFCRRFRQHDRTMTSPGASKGDRQVALPFPDIVRN